MGPRGFWIALAIVLFYLIARPHLGTAWYVTVGPRPTTSGGCSATPPGFMCPPTPSPPPVSHFSDEIDCLRYLGGTIYDPSYRCDDHLTLLWGW
jgi:hypothetical protein